MASTRMTHPRNSKILLQSAIVAFLVSLTPAASAAPADAAKAKEIFDQMCAGCHGTYGNGQEGTKAGFVPRIGTLADKEYMASVPDDYLTMIIKKGGAYMGKIAAMPAWETKFDDAQIADLVAHIRTFTIKKHEQ